VNVPAKSEVHRLPLPEIIAIAGLGVANFQSWGHGLWEMKSAG